MALQNRIALDMLQAEKGGVCGKFGEQRCTFISDNTAPDGRLTREHRGSEDAQQEDERTFRCGHVDVEQLAGPVWTV